MAEQLVPSVEPAGVSAEKPFHARDQIGLRRFEDQMKMIPHQAIRVHLPIGLGASFAESFQKPSPILIIAKNVFLPVATIHHVIDRAGKFNSQSPSHARRVNCRSDSCQYY